MKFIKTVQLWDSGVQESIASGKLKLQRGQWVKCGGSAPARWVALRGGSLWVAHPEGDKGTRDSFPRLCAAAAPRVCRPSFGKCAAYALTLPGVVSVAPMPPVEQVQVNARIAGDSLRVWVAFKDSSSCALECWSLPDGGVYGEF